MDNKKQIGDRTYSFGTVPAEEAVKVEVAVARVVGEPLFKAFMESKTPGADKQAEDQAGALAIGMMLSKMDSTELLQTMATVLKYTGTESKPRLEVNDFTGRNKELWQVFIAALRFNFSDFLPEGLFVSLQGKITK